MLVPLCVAQVTVDRADGMISEMDANRVLFFVGGIAALTLVVNATTCPARLPTVVDNSLCAWVMHIVS